MEYIKNLLGKEGEEDNIGVESMKDITLKELAEQRIGEFTDALRKYILD